MLTAAIAATFLNRPISIEVGVDPNKKDCSNITVTSKHIDDQYMDSLTDCIIGFCDWVTGTLRREADCHRENSQVICTVQVRWAELSLKVLSELQTRLWRYEDRVAATAGVSGFERGRRMTMHSRGVGRQQDCSGVDGWQDLV